jgi:thermitase
MKRILITMTIGLGFSLAHAAPDRGDYLIKFKNNTSTMFRSLALKALPAQSSVESLDFDGWHQVQIPRAQLQNFRLSALSKLPGVEYVQPNYKVRLLEQPSLAQIKEQLKEHLKNEPNPDDVENLASGGPADIKKQDNPEIPAVVQNPGQGEDPLFSNQWGMIDVGVTKAWNRTMGRKEVVVAVIDTGVDYTHEDLVANLWRNPGETGPDLRGRDKATNGIDDDGNGYIDDQIGWDFVSNDNKPYDLAYSGMDLLSGGNPGHGTHCAGNVAARGKNGKGVTGVAPNISIMSLRFLSEDGQGTTAGAIKAIRYALRNGAHITSNSWGSEGEDPREAKENKALRDAIQASQDKGVLFVAAAGNGHDGVGYDNDTDSLPGFPASYDHDVIISVAALDSTDHLGSFSNWGVRTVDIGAPGVKIFSTTVKSQYSDTVINIPNMITATWDGTSMATPYVAGAAALYLSANPKATWREIKKAILQTAMPIPDLSGKLVSGGKLNVEKLMMQ